MSSIGFFDLACEAYEYIKNKKPELHYDYDEVMYEAHNRVFTIAKIMQLDLLTDLQIALARAQKEGLSYDDWRKNVNDTLIKKGWLGDVEVTNPKTGEKKQIHVGERRLKNIYYTNLKTAYARGQWESIQSSNLPYLRYSAVLDNRTRKAHADMHGVIKPKDDLWWQTNYPPNGWNCRCSVMALDNDDLKRRGLKLDERTLPNVAEIDWAYHVGEGGLDELDELYIKKLDKLAEKGVSDEFISHAKNNLSNFARERKMSVWRKSLGLLLSDDNAKISQIGMISNFTPSIEIKGVKVESAGLIITKEEAKKLTGVNLVEILTSDENLYIDTEKQNLCFVLSKKDNECVVAVVELEETEKFQTKNYFIKIKKLNLKRLKKVKNDKG